MKKIFAPSMFILLVAGLMGLSSCDKKLKNPIPITVEHGHENIKFTIPVINKTGAISIGSFSTKAGIDSIKQANGASSLPLKSLKIKSATFNIATATGGTFDFLDELNLTISAAGVPDKKIAWLKPIPKGVFRIELKVDDQADLAPYFNASIVSLKADGIINDSIRKPIDITGSVKYSMTFQ